MALSQPLKLVKLTTVLLIVAACGFTNVDVDLTSTSAPPIAATDGSSREAVCVAQVVEQSFENGFMFWVGRTSAEKCAQQHGFAPGSGEIWVAYVNSKISSGKWQVYVDDWTSGVDPESDLSINAPPGLIQPIRGFGKVWRTKLSEADRTLLGWATGSEYLIESDYRYEGDEFVNTQGEVITRPGKHFLVGLAGDVFIFDEVSQTVEYMATP